ncbi:MAG: hypothetical protein LIP12_00095 [Clostridiales bacterium]|nr:hypothetical protein [Clostridiales bacterium]
MKVKLTPFGTEIYYHKYDEVNKAIIKRHGKPIEPKMPKIDNDGFTEFQLWEFIQLYGDHIGLGIPNVIVDNNFYIEDSKLMEVAE